MADINAKVLLMLPVAIEELHEAAGEPDIAKVLAFHSGGTVEGPRRAERVELLCGRLKAEKAYEKRLARRQCFCQASRTA